MFVICNSINWSTQKVVIQQKMLHLPPWGNTEYRGETLASVSVKSMIFLFLLGPESWALWISLELTFQRQKAYFSAEYRRFIYLPSVEGLFICRVQKVYLSVECRRFIYLPNVEGLFICRVQKVYLSAEYRRFIYLPNAEGLFICRM